MLFLQVGHHRPRGHDAPAAGHLGFILMSSASATSYYSTETTNNFLRSKPLSPHQRHGPDQNDLPPSQFGFPASDGLTGRLQRYHRVADSIAARIDPGEEL